MVRARQRREPGEAGRALEDRARVERVAAHERELLPRSAARACRGSGWRSRACRRRAAAPPGACRRSDAVLAAEQHRDAHRDHARAVGVAVGPRRLGVDHARERVGDPVQVGLVGRQPPLARLPRLQARPPAASARTRVSPRVRVQRRRPAAGRTSRRCGAPRPAARASSPRAAWKISTVCARHRIRAPSGISSPRSPSGWPRPSQCSSSARIAAAVPGPEPEQPRDLRPALAAGAHQRAGDLGLVAERHQLHARASAATRRARPSAASTGTRCTSATSRPAWSCAWRAGRRPRTAPPSAPSSPSSPRP